MRRCAQQSAAVAGRQQAAAAAGDDGTVIGQPYLPATQGTFSIPLRGR